MQFQFARYFVEKLSLCTRRCMFIVVKP